VAESIAIDTLPALGVVKGNRSRNFPDVPGVLPNGMTSVAAFALTGTPMAKADAAARPSTDFLIFMTLLLPRSIHHPAPAFLSAVGCGYGAYSATVLLQCNQNAAISYQDGTFCLISGSADRWSGRAAFGFRLDPTQHK